MLAIGLKYLFPKMQYQYINLYRICFIACCIFLSLPLKAAVELASKPYEGVINCCLANLNTGVIQQDGKIIVAGDFTAVDNIERFKLARLNSDGSLDNTWSTGRFKGGDKVPFTKLLVTANHQLYVAGSFTAYNEQVTLNLVRLNDDGSLDNTWKPAIPSSTIPLVTEARVYTIALDRLNHLYVSGSFKEPATQQLSYYLVRLNSDGSLDKNWSYQFNGLVNNLVVDADNQLYIGGYFTTINGEVHSYFARFKNDGSFDSNWQLSVIPTDKGELTLLLDENKFVYVAGSFNLENDPVSTVYLRRFDLNGNLDKTWVPAINDSVKKAVLDKAGNLYLVGKFSGYAMRLASDGSVSSLNQYIVAEFTVNAPMDILVSDDNNVYIAGFINIFTPDFNYRSLVHLNSELSYDTAFKARIANNQDAIVALNHDNKNREYIAGQFTHLGKVGYQNLARFNADGSVDENWKPSSRKVIVNGVVNDTKGITYIFGKDYYSPNYNDDIDRFNPDGSMDTNWVPYIAGYINQIAIDSKDRFYVVGSFPFLILNDGSFTDNGKLIRFNPDGSLDKTWKPLRESSVTFDTVTHISIDNNDNIYVIGHFATDSTGKSKNFAYIAADGTIKSDWNNAIANGKVTAMQVDKTGKLYLAMAANSLNIASAVTLLKVNNDGSYDANWKIATLNKPIHSISVDENNAVYLAGEFTQVNAVARQGFAKLSPTGEVDSDWQITADVLPIQAMDINGQNQVYLGGSFTEINHQTRVGLAALTETTAASPVKVNLSYNLEITSATILTLSAQLSGGVNPSGTISFKLNGVAITGCSELPLNKGKADCIITNPQANNDPLNYNEFAATYSGNNTNLPAQSVDLQLSSYKLAQVITFFGLSSKPLNSADFLLNASGGASNQPLTFSSASPTICEVSTNANGTSVHLVSRGLCSINAHQAGNEQYLPVDVQQSFVVTASSPTANQAPIIYCGDGTLYPENSNSIVMDVCATDDYDQENNNLVFRLTADSPDNNWFNLDKLSGVLTFKSPPDYENPQDNDKNNSYKVVLLVCDTQNACTQQGITVNVTDIAEGNAIKLSVRAFLQGAYQSLEGLMSDNLRSLQLIPYKQPYTAAPFNYAGAETISSAISNLTETNSMVDWVLVELRDATTPSKIIARQAAVLQKDGDIVDASTASNVLYFDNVVAGHYYIAIRHRNHLGVMTAQALALEGKNATLVDFTQLTTATYGIHARLLTTSIALLWAGDANQNGSAIAQGINNDLAPMSSLVLNDMNNTTVSLNYKVNGYYSSDINLDDMILCAGIDNDVNMLLGNVLLHPANQTNNAANYIIRAQLP